MDTKAILNEIGRLRADLKLQSKGLLTIEEAALYLGISPKTIRNGLGPRASKPFPVKPVRWGSLKRVHFRRVDLEAFVASLGTDL